MDALDIGPDEKEAKAMRKSLILQLNGCAKRLASLRAQNGEAAETL